MAIPKPITIRPTEQEILRFWSYVNTMPSQGPNGDCWEWTKHRHGKGLPYGTIKLRRQMFIASRIAYFLCYGKDPWPFQVCHRCDNAPCCRPDHLFTGTPKDNQEDMVRKGRSTTGDRNGQRKHPERTARGMKQGLSKLTDQDVINIRRFYATGNYSSRRLSRIYNMSKSSILDIVSGYTWKHLPLGGEVCVNTIMSVSDSSCSSS
jgi:hypothetical protein